MAAPNSVAGLAQLVWWELPEKTVEPDDAALVVNCGAVHPDNRALAVHPHFPLVPVAVVVPSVDAAHPPVLGGRHVALCFADQRLECVDTDRPVDRIREHDVG